MSAAREKYNPIILKLLRQHDALPIEMMSERNAIQRQLLHIMSTVKCLEIDTI